MILSMDSTFFFGKIIFRVDNEIMNITKCFDTLLSVSIDHIITCMKNPLFSKKVEPMVRALYSCLYFTMEYKTEFKNPKNFVFNQSILRVSKWIRNIPKIFPTTYPTMKSFFFIFTAKIHFLFKNHCSISWNRNSLAAYVLTYSWVWPNETKGIRLVTKWQMCR